MATDPNDPVVINKEIEKLFAPLLAESKKTLDTLDQLSTERAAILYKPYPKATFVDYLSAQVDRLANEFEEKFIKQGEYQIRNRRPGKKMYSDTMPNLLVDFTYDIQPNALFYFMRDIIKAQLPALVEKLEIPADAVDDADYDSAIKALDKQIAALTERRQALDTQMKLINLPRT